MKNNNEFIQESSLIRRKKLGQFFTPEIIAKWMAEWAIQKNTETVLDSKSKAIEKISETNISIIPITTIPDLPNNNRQCCYFGSKQIPKENWSSISIIDDVNFKFHFKNDLNTYGLFSYPCTGRIVADKIHLKNSIKQIDSYKKADILSLVEILIKKYGYKIIFEKWFDIVHKQII